MTDHPTEGTALLTANQAASIADTLEAFLKHVDSERMWVDRLAALRAIASGECVVVPRSLPAGGGAGHEKDSGESKKNQQNSGPWVGAPVAWVTVVNGRIGIKRAVWATLRKGQPLYAHADREFPKLLLQVDDLRIKVAAALNSLETIRTEKLAAAGLHAEAEAVGRARLALDGVECNCGGTDVHLLSCPLNPAFSMLRHTGRALDPLPSAPEARASQLRQR